jgi:hypothetical protein
MDSIVSGHALAHQTMKGIGNSARVVRSDLVLNGDVADYVCKRIDAIDQYFLVSHIWDAVPVVMVFRVIQHGLGLSRIFALKRRSCFGHLPDQIGVLTGQNPQLFILIISHEFSLILPTAAKAACDGSRLDTRLHRQGANDAKNSRALA